MVVQFEQGIEGNIRGTRNEWQNQEMSDKKKQWIGMKNEHYLFRYKNNVV